MPRKRRIDARGAVHHVMARGIERRKIFQDDKDRGRFVEMLGEAVKESGTLCYAWCLMPNHFHLLLETGKKPVSRVMQSILTRYAIYFNGRHRRRGHLFQNRYKSVLCEKEAYWLELIRYLHLNPVRGGIVKGMAGLERYPWTGHAVLLGHGDEPWQTVAPVLRRFGGANAQGQGGYRQFVEAGARMGRRKELAGGGMVRSHGGWEEVKKAYRRQEKLVGDERILGSSEFVETVLEEEKEGWRRIEGGGKAVTPEKVIERVGELCGLRREGILGNGKDRPRSEARRIASAWLVDQAGMSQREASQMLGVDPSAVSHAVKRGREIIRTRKLQIS